jgi:hypothetical protein
VVELVEVDVGFCWLLAESALRRRAIHVKHSKQSETRTSWWQDSGGANLRKCSKNGRSFRSFDWTHRAGVWLFVYTYPDKNCMGYQKKARRRERRNVSF